MITLKFTGYLGLVLEKKSSFWKIKFAPFLALEKISPIFSVSLLDLKSFHVGFKRAPTKHQMSLNFGKWLSTDLLRWKMLVLMKKACITFYWYYGSFWIFGQSDSHRGNFPQNPVKVNNQSGHGISDLLSELFTLFRNDAKWEALFFSFNSRSCTDDCRDFRRQPSNDFSTTCSITNLLTYDL